MQTRHYFYVLLLTLSAFATVYTLAQGRDPASFPAQSIAWTAEREIRAFADEFTGITTNGQIVDGLFSIQPSDTDTNEVRDAATQFLQTLSAEQLGNTQYSADSLEWRRWANQSIYHREGISFDAMNELQKQAARNLLGLSLSAKGLTLAEDIMHLNETLGELNNNNFVEFGDGKYWLTFMGEPSATQPWGWQLEGHHLAINYFVLGNQVVMTPTFWGSEPAVATAGKYAGTRIMDEEQEKGLALIRSLNMQQQQAAIIMASKTANNIMTEAFSDNVVLDYSGIEVRDFTLEQKATLMDLIGLYIGNMSAEQAEVKMAEITSHLDSTWFAWIGDTQDNSVFYYRIQSPVLLIEFDHETPVGLTQYYPSGVPYREHIHSVVRTPNGNDYGKDLLRQHYASQAH